MNKREIIEIVSKKTDKSLADAERSVNAVIESIEFGLQKDKVVQLFGFGSFEVKKRKARKGRNPQTGEVIEIKASKSVGFKPGKALKHKVN